jgi:acyl carrier protein
VSSQSQQETERKLHRFIAEELLEERYDGRDPLATDAVDSLGVEQLVEYIEEEFDVILDDEEIVVENFESVPALAAFVDAKRAGAKA